MSKKNISQKKQSSAGSDPAEAAMQIARVLPAVVLATASERAEMRSVVSRAPASFIALVAKLAEDNGGNVGGLAIDATAMRTAQTEVERLRFGATAARAVARYLENEALTRASGIAQEALSATTSLQALARTQSGRTFAAQAEDLRAAQRKGGRRPTAKPAKDSGNTTTPNEGADAKPVANVATTPS